MHHELEKRTQAFIGAASLTVAPKVLPSFRTGKFR